MNKKIRIVIIILIAAVGIPFGVYTISPIFTSSTVNESLPTTTVIATGAKSYSGNFTGAGDGIHNAAGTAKVVALGDGSKILRLENFRSTNGPNVHVYLSTDKRPSDYVDLER